MKGITRNPGLVLLFSIITCGIYLWYWIYTTSNEMRNYLNDENINPTAELLLSLFTCGIYYIYWLYKYSKLASEAQARAGIQPVDDNSVLCVILPFLGLSIVSVMIIQNSINKVWAAN